jgi:predicted transcriptional regulator
MAKRGRLEIIYDILVILKDSSRGIKPTPLLRKSNLSGARFKEYYTEMLEKEFIKENLISREKKITITEKGILFLDKYDLIVGFIEEFKL